MKIRKQHALAFDDVLLVPRYNDIPSRQDPSIDTSVRISSELTLGIPLISSPMDTITEDEMAIELARLGGLGIVHRYNTIYDQVVIAKKIIQQNARAGFAIGATGDFMERVSALSNEGADIFCVDVAHGDSQMVIEAVTKIRQAYGLSTIIAGNVASGSAAIKLARAGADAIRIGIGSGSLCSTRIQTGNGIPTLESLIDCYEQPFGSLKGVCLIADGGIKNSGDCVKSLASGANAVMLGRLLAGSHCTPGKAEEVDGRLFKRYRGMASISAQKDRLHHSTKLIVPEGEETLVPFSGLLKDIVAQLMGGVRSGMTYQGARSFNELRDNAEFVQITNAGLVESHPHAKHKP